MPLSKGASSNAISRNIEEMLRSYKRTGMIGVVRPSNPAHARRIASAAAYAAATGYRKAGGG